MLNNYLKTTLRHLWRNRLFTALNILGLAIGISGCWVIYRLVNYEFSFDRLPNRNQIYRVVSRFKSDEKESGNAGVPKPLAAAIQSSVPGIVNAVPVWDLWRESVQAPGVRGARLRFEEPKDLITTTSQYFALVPYRWLAGKATTALDAPNKVVLTQSRAQTYFPGMTPAQILGRTLTYDDTIAVQVAGVVADLDYPSSFIGKEFFPVVTTEEVTSSWGNVSSNNALYIQLGANASTQQVLSQINAVSIRNGAKELRMYHLKRWHLLMPLSEVHFSTDYGEHLRKANKSVLYGLIGIAVFLLLLACVNYINLTTAQVPQRAKEIGIRKTLGSSRWHLIRQFLGETLVIASLAVGLSYFLSRWALTAFGELLPEGLDQYANYGQLALFLGFLLLGITMLSGLYPGWLITRVQAVTIMRGQATVQVGKGRLTLRKSLIVFQFVVAQLFIVGTLLVGQQLHYLLNKDMGFDQEAVLLVDVPWKLWNKPAYEGRQLTMREELAKQPAIAQVALGNAPMNTSSSNNNFQYKNRKGQIVERTVYLKYVDTTLIGLYKIPLLAGRNLLPADTTREYLLNETAVRAFGFRSPQEAVGQTIQELEGKPIPVVGVVRDFHSGPFYKKIEPMLLRTEKTGLMTFNIKLRSNDPAQWQAAIRQIEQVWTKFYPTEPFEYKFYDSTLEEMYTNERNMARIIHLATAVAIIISCLGLFGLSTLTAFQRTKEVGIRKVLGATVASLVGLLTKDFLKLVFFAILIASPIAYYFTDKWLQDFAYKIDIDGWVFVLAGAGAVAIAFLTVSYQSIRAALMNPVKSLKTE